MKEKTDIAVRPDQRHLAERMRKDLGLSSNQGLSLELIDRWLGLADHGKYDRSVALKSAKLNQTHIDRIAKYSEIDQVLDEVEDQIVVASSVHYLGEKYTIGHMGLLINSVFNFIKVGRAIDGSVMPEICNMIISEFGLWLTFADLKLCLKMGVTNKFGTTYDRVDTQIIFNWIEQYRTLRFNLSEERRKETLRKQRAEDKGVPMPPDIKEKMEALELKMKTKEQPKGEFEPSLSKQLDHLRTEDF